jgi:hypothetical protein
MKKHILAMTIATTLLTANTSALTYKSTDQGFENLEHLGGTIGGVVDDGFEKLVDAIKYIGELPDVTTVWTVGQVAELKDKICEKPITITNTVEVIKEVPVEKIVEKIVYVDRIVNVPATPKERNCTTKRQSDRFGNVDEVINCTEWK